MMPKATRVTISVHGEASAQAIFDTLAGGNRALRMRKSGRGWYRLVFDLRPFETPGEVVAFLRQSYPSAQFGLHDVEAP